MFAVIEDTVFRKMGLHEPINEPSQGQFVITRWVWRRTHNHTASQYIERVREVVSPRGRYSVNVIDGRMVDPKYGVYLQLPRTR